MTISGPIVTSDSTASLASQTTSLSLEATKSLETRVKHNWAFVCYDKNGLPDKDIYHQCADSLTGYYCDANGMVRLIFIFDLEMYGAEVRIGLVACAKLIRLLGRLRVH